jgi:dTDP-4-dehydrorhamnose 3,5-epimerase-like enzyme
MKIKNIINENNIEGGIVSYEPLSGFYNRVYFIYGAKKGVVRGYHAHKTLEQVLVCVYGSIEVTLFDGKVEKVYNLNNPNQNLKVGAMIWRTMKWLSDDSVLFVLATDQYDESDYIRNFDEYKRMVND